MSFVKDKITRSIKIALNKTTDNVHVSMFTFADCKKWNLQISIRDYAFGESLFQIGHESA